MLDEARDVSGWWQNHYNHRRPHSSLGYQPPARFAASDTIRRSHPDSHNGGYIVFRQATPDRKLNHPAESDLTYPA